MSRRLLRPAIIATTLMGAAIAQAQTTTSVQDGPWDDPATWDCGCLPVIEDVEVQHAVEITGNIIFFNAHVHINPGGLLFSTSPYSIAITESMTSDGALQFMGDVDIDGVLVIQGAAQVIGELHNDNRLFLGGGAAHLHVEGDMANDGTIDGVGSICVTGLTANTDSILGQVDICDATPTTATPPILDLNTGHVGPGVTFCAAAACVASTGDGSDQHDVELFPIPADRRLNMRGLPIVYEVTVLDGTGRAVEVPAVQDGLDVSGLPSGTYTLVIRNRTVRLAQRFMVLDPARP